ncbi:MAG: hypothetical protein M1134_07145 [Actinobacteria bacterium]|nr:hypothetical protein [Actinomycetota bacterium]
MAGTAFSREEIEAFISALEADPELRSRVERVILHDRLLAIPEHLDHFIEATDRRFSTLEEVAAETSRNVSELSDAQRRTEAALAELSRNVSELSDAQRRTEAALAELSRNVAELTELAGRHEVSVGHLIGGYFETKWRENGTSYLGSQGFRKVRYIAKNALADLLDEVADQVHDDILLADAVHSVVRKDLGTEAFVVTEVSSRIHRDDVVRASRRARSLQDAVHTECVPVVAGASIDDMAKSLANESKVIVVVPNEWQLHAA